MMEALTALHNRVSSSRMTEEEPAAEVLEAVFRSALRAADHARLRPWRFLVIRGEARERLGGLFADTIRANVPEAEDRKLDKARGKALRAPVIVVAISSPRPHPKVPVFEQELATGAAMQNMLNAAYAMELGAIWRTGSMADSPQVRSGLGLEREERIIGFLYLGYTDGPQRPAPELPVAEFFREWPGQ
jgi:nitroreductase